MIVYGMISSILRTLGWCLYGGCLYHVTNRYVISLVKCEGESMCPTINVIVESNDYVLVEKWSLRNKKFKKNDIVILKCPDQPSQLICKRITRLEGQTTPTSKTIPRCHVWVEGDNKISSHDSRTFGPVPLALVKGRVWLRVWPLTQFGQIT